MPSRVVRRRDETRHPVKDEIADAACDRTVTGDDGVTEQHVHHEPIAPFQDDPFMQGLCEAIHRQSTRVTVVSSSNVTLPAKAREIMQPSFAFLAIRSTSVRSRSVAVAGTLMRVV